MPVGRRCQLHKADHGPGLAFVQDMVGEERWIEPKDDVYQLALRSLTRLLSRVDHRFAVKARAEIDRRHRGRGIQNYHLSETSSIRLNVSQKPRLIDQDRGRRNGVMTRRLDVAGRIEAKAQVSDRTALFGLCITAQ